MSEMQMALTNTAGITSVMSFWVFVASNGFKNRKDLLVKIGSWTLTLAFAAVTAAIITRGIDAQRFPLANLYESLLWFAWATMGAYLALAKAYGVRQLGWLASLTALLMFLYGSWLPQSQHDIQPLVPALVSYWRWIHVPPLITALSGRAHRQSYHSGSDSISGDTCSGSGNVHIRRNSLAANSLCRSQPCGHDHFFQIIAAN
jgi:hypothetical protein